LMNLTFLNEETYFVYIQLPTSVFVEDSEQFQRGQLVGDHDAVQVQQQVIRSACFRSREPLPQLPLLEDLQFHKDDWEPTAR